LNESWKISALASKDRIESALAAQEEFADWDPAIALSGSESGPGDPDSWQLEAWLPREPDDADKAAIAALFDGNVPELVVERLPKTDWVAESQRAIEPIRAGRFYVHTPEYPASDEEGVVDFVIPAGQAFGTGQHETTSGCLAMLDVMKRRGVIARNFADIGTGTGLLAFAALALWPRAQATASDIDPVCIGVLEENAAANGVTLGQQPGEMLMTVAGGMNSPLIEAREPFDLIMANILAGPLIDLAPSFADALVPGGQLLLAGLLVSQERSVRTACMRAGLRLAARLVRGDWSVLWLRRRALR